MCARARACVCVKVRVRVRVCASTCTVYARACKCVCLFMCLCVRLCSARKLSTWLRKERREIVCQLGLPSQYHAATSSTYNKENIRIIIVLQSNNIVQSL